MNASSIVRILVHIACFGVSMYALNALDYERFIRKGRSMQAQLLHLLLAMSIGFLAAQFLLSLTI